jgi:hypothetical protein
MTNEDRIIAYLNAHKGSIEFSTMDLVIADVKQSVFYGMSPISDDEIRTIVARWAAFNAVGLLLDPALTNPAASPAPRKPAPLSDSELSDLIDAIKKAVSTVGAGVTLPRKGAANINLSVTGLTAKLKTGGTSVSLGVSVGEALMFKVESGPFHVSANLSSSSWDITLSFPRDTYIHDLAKLPTVFTNGERAVEKIANALPGLDNVADIRKFTAVIKPDVAAVQEAIGAASGIAKANRTGGSSFGFKLGSPPSTPGQQGIPPGWQVTVDWTIWNF